MKFIDLTGQKFGRLTVIERCQGPSKKHTYYRCICDCGNEHIAESYNLKTGKVTSCGCYASESSKKRHTTHNLSKTRLYDIYYCMKDRCYNPKNKRYNCYGGRGIFICDEWNDDFIKFHDWAISHGYKENLTIERINVNKGYCPENCKWIPMRQQANNKTNSHRLTLHGETHTMAEWSRITGIGYYVINCRLRRGWSVEETLTTPQLATGKRRH